MWIVIGVKLMAAGTLFWMSLEDIKTKSVSLKAIGLLFLLGVFNFLFGSAPTWWSLLMGAVLGILLILFSFASRQKLGMADALSITGLGVLFGVELSFLIFVAALFLLLLVSIPGLFCKKISLTSELPFLPFLFVSFIGVILCA
ncbi:MAG: hypothetical protein PWP24_12 [Clostridiales bacterium]|nr:hypothetical protein [Clostridiales bacterium]